MLLQEYLVPLLLKLGVMASIASILARSATFKSMLMLENRTLNQRLTLSSLLSVVFGASVAVRVLIPKYQVADLGLEGSLIAGILGGYVTGLVSGVLISLPAMFSGQHHTMPRFAGIGVLGALLRDLAPNPEELWRFSFFDLSI
jgi:two-component system LytT family sensor kinase